MNVVIFSDVHGNLIALEQFLASTKDFAEAYICLGDIVNYGPWNDECLQLILSLPNITLLMGNHEEIFNKDIDLIDELPLVQQFTYKSIQYFTKFNLIKRLPKQLDINGHCCTHTIGKRSIYSDTEIAINQNYIIGHSHHQYRIERTGCSIANPGSVGQNRKWINVVDYLIYNLETNRFEFKSIPYNVDLFISELRARKYPAKCIEYYENKNRLSE